MGSLERSLTHGKAVNALDGWKAPQYSRAVMRSSEELDDSLCLMRGGAPAGLNGPGPQSKAWRIMADNRSAGPLGPRAAQQRISCKCNCHC
jgi:hypothetical protein